MNRGREDNLPEVKRNRGGVFRLILLFVLLAASVALLLVFHMKLKWDVFVSHFFYLPIVLAALWWDWRGVSVALFLSAALLISHAVSGIKVSLWAQAGRSAVLLLVGMVVAALSRRRRVLEDSLADHVQDLERKVEERTRELTDKNRELEAYAQTISHDLNAPLVIVEGYVDLLRERMAGPLGAEERDYLERISRSAERMRRLIASLLTYARSGLEAGSPEPVDAGEVFGEVLMDRAMDLENLGVELATPPDYPVVLVDRSRLQQVFSNLLDNALKYRARNEPPRLELGWRRSGKEACLFLRDNGPGINRENLEEVFQPFRRIHASEDPGLGLGLSIVKRAVEGWGGRVWAESQPGRGSTFFFTAPLAEAAGEARERPSGITA